MTESQKRDLLTIARRELALAAEALKRLEAVPVAELRLWNNQLVDASSACGVADTAIDTLLLHVLRECRREPPAAGGG